MTTYSTPIDLQTRRLAISTCIVYDKGLLKLSIEDLIVCVCVNNN